MLNRKKSNQPINRSDYISYSVVVGQNQKRLGALIVLDKEKILDFVNSNKINYGSFENLISKLEIIELIKKEILINVNNENFRTFERIYDFKIVYGEFNIEEEITQTLKLKRHVIYEKYKK